MGTGGGEEEEGEGAASLLPLEREGEEFFLSAGAEDCSKFAVPNEEEEKEVKGGGDADDDDKGDVDNDDDDDCVAGFPPKPRLVVDSAPTILTTGSCIAIFPASDVELPSA